LVINPPKPTRGPRCTFSFLGLTGYYRKFVRNYGILAKPLTQILQHKQFSWSVEAQKAFERLKTAMTSTPVLALPDFTQPFVIETDACDKGVGVVLAQNGHPISFFSKALSVSNQRLSTYEKEFLVVLMAVDKWHNYLNRHLFMIQIDRKSLYHLQDQNMSN
jgi:hypothetical protein